MLFEVFLHWETIDSIFYIFWYKLVCIECRKSTSGGLWRIGWMGNMSCIHAHNGGHFPLSISLRIKVFLLYLLHLLYTEIVRVPTVYKFVHVFLSLQQVENCSDHFTEIWWVTVKCVLEGWVNIHEDSVGYVYYCKYCQWFKIIYMQCNYTCLYPHM